MKGPKISIIIPSFNKGEYIYETLDSIVNQTYRNFEVIIQDGGSTDDTVRIIKEFHKRFPDIINWVSKKDKGQLDAINNGLKKSKGSILTYINADDVYFPSAFESVAKAYTNSPNSLWFAGRSVVINKVSKEIAKPVTLYKNMLMSLNRYSLLLITNYLMQPSVFITRKAYEKYGPFTGNEKFIVEYDMWLKLGKVEMPTVIPEALSRFRLEPGTITSTQTDHLLESDLEVVEKYTNNTLILALHKLNNEGRKIVMKIA